MKVSILLKPYRCGLGRVFEQAGYKRISYDIFTGTVNRDLYISDVPKDEAIELYNLCKEQEGKSYNVVIAVRGTQESKEKLKDYFTSIESMILGQ